MARVGPKRATKKRLLPQAAGPALSRRTLAPPARLLFFACLCGSNGKAKANHKISEQDCRRQQARSCGGRASMDDLACFQTECPPTNSFPLCAFHT
jgi:hypothetical protein